MQSILVEDPTVSFIPGAIMVREISSLGVPGSQVPSGSPGIPSYLFDCVDLPADANAEFRGEVTSHTVPPGFFEYYDDGSWRVLAGCPDGIYTYTVQLYVDGPAVGAPFTNTIIVGNGTVLSISGTMDPFTAALSFTGALPTLAIGATMGPFTASFVLVGDVSTVLPDPLSLARQYRVNPDEHLDAYSITHGYAMTWEKDPDAKLDYSVDWTDWLADIPGDDIASLAVTPTGITVHIQAVLGPVTAVVVSGGSLNAIAQVVMRITTTQGRVEDRTITLVIRQR